ncbi:hypothetical protein IGI47_001824 [Enterococcus sp. AZ191]|uniref:hypothetical protein n=1 Tax=Enterococcus sp. AZ191 TaxID=2774639 RepID=UPI003F2577EF
MNYAFEDNFGYYKKGFIYSLIVVLFTLFLSCFSIVVVRADNQENIFIDTTILDLEDLPSDVPIEETLIEMNQQRLKKIDSEILKPRSADQLLRGPTIIGANIIRMSGTTCQLYLAWSGTESISSWRANNIKATNLNLIGPATYLNINNYFRNTTASLVGTTYVGTMSIPTRETRVRVSVSNLQAYYLIYGWRSGIINNGIVIIN